MVEQKRISAEEHEAKLWELVKQYSSGNITVDQLIQPEIGWVEEKNSVERMRLFLVYGTILAYLIWFAGGLLALFLKGNVGVLIASPTIIYPIYKILSYYYGKK